MATMIQTLLDRLNAQRAATAAAVPVPTFTMPTVSGTRTDPIYNGVPAPSAVTVAQSHSPTAPAPGTVAFQSFANAVKETPADSIAPTVQAENRAQLLKIAAAAVVFWFAYGYLSKGR